MGNSDTKHSYREAILELTTRTQPIESEDDEFWSQFWHGNYIDSIQDLFQMLTAQEIRTLRDESPSNLSTLCYKAVEQLVKVTDTLCNTTSQQKTVLTCVNLLTRILPYIFEDSDWRIFFCSNLPGSGLGSSGSGGYDNEMYRKFGTRFGNSGGGVGGGGGDQSSSSTSMYEMMDQSPLAQSILLALADLLFCPDFTVAPLDSKGTRFGAPDTPPEDLQSIDSCEYIWEAGVGCSIPSTGSIVYDQNRTELLRLLLTCFSESMYCSTYDVGHKPNRWIEFFTSNQNRHALPLFTSLLNTVFAYNPNSYLPFNHLLFSDSKEPLVEVALQILIVTLDHDFSQAQLLNECIGSSSASAVQTTGIQTTTQTFKSHKFALSSASGDGSGSGGGSGASVHSSGSATFGQDNLFINYISRIHREDDFEFILKGFTRLLNNPLQQSYLPNSTKRIQFHQELLVLFWKICDYNKKFMYYVLKTCDVLKILVPILYHLNDARADRSRVGLVHIGVFIILLLSGERNFGVRLNRPYLASAPMDLPIFSGTHADLLVIVFHKLITTGHQRLQPLFDCLLTILVNVSPYLKTLSMVASSKILHLLEAFSTPWFLFSNPTNHHLVFFLLEIFNNIIQYQFDGNSNLIYTIIRKRHIFHSLSNIPTDYGSIQRSLSQAKLSGSAVAALSPSSSSTSTQPSQFRRQSTKSHLHHHRKLTRPLSLAEPPSTFLSQNQFGGDGVGGSGTGSHSNPTTPQFPAPSRSFAEFIDNMNDNHHHHHHQPQQQQQHHPESVASTSKSNPIQNEDSHHADVHHNPRTSAISHSSASNITSSTSVAPAGGSTSVAESTNHNVNVTLAAVPRLNKMIEKLHPNPKCIEPYGSSGERAENDSGDYEHEYSVHVGEDQEDDQDDYDDNHHRHHYNYHHHNLRHAKENSTDTEFGNVTPIHESIKRASHGSGYQRTSSISRQSSTASERTAISSGSGRGQPWAPTSEWILSWKQKLPLQTIMRMLQVLVPQVEKMCIDKGITDENEILKFLQHGTLVGLLPVPHPILIRKYQTNIGTTIWFRTYMWGVIYLRNSDPPIWYDTNVKLFEIQKN